MKEKVTDWTNYYLQKKSWFSTYTQRYTTDVIVDTIHKYINIESEFKINILELGGGNSCFAKDVCEKCDVGKYDIIDNNELAVELYEDVSINADSHRGILYNLLENDEPICEEYDFVYSVGLIEHFRGDDIIRIIDKHYNYCKKGGCVVITFPTPTKKYRFFRRCMELLGVWQFYDEKPIKWEELKSCFEDRGIVLGHFVNKKLPLSQLIVINRK